MRRSVWSVAAFALLNGAALVASAGPISPLYISDSFGKISVVQGSGVINSWPTLDVEASIAVNTSVRTYGQDSQNLGREYTLGGATTGVTFPNTVGCCFRDGTTDGVFNYAIRDVPAPDNALYRFNLDWSNPQVVPLIVSGGGLGPAGIGTVEGITYDPRDGTLWFALPGSFGLVYNATLQGQILAFFGAGPLNTGVALAFDSADSTLWVTTSTGTTGGDALLRQFPAVKTFDVLGTDHPLLDSLVLPTTRPFGAEFAFHSAAAAVPEASTLALSLIAFVSVVMLRTRRLAPRSTRR